MRHEEYLGRALDLIAVLQEGRERTQRLTILLHTHMQNVRVVEHGVWPVGEEWLWEAAAMSVSAVAGRAGPTHPGKVTLSVTPVLR